MGSLSAGRFAEGDQRLRAGRGGHECSRKALRSRGFGAVDRKRAPDLVRVGSRADRLAWLFHALTAAGVPAVCLDARMRRRAVSAPNNV